MVPMISNHWNLCVFVCCVCIYVVCVCGGGGGWGGEGEGSYRSERVTIMEAKARLRDLPMEQ